MERSATGREEPTYRRRYGLIQRLYQLFIRPSDVMEDIALSPDYWGIGIIIASQFVWTIFMVLSILSRFRITGPHARPAAQVISAGMGLTLVLLAFLLPIRWLIKSAIVWKACN